jgi:hypothetical protein
VCAFLISLKRTAIAVLELGPASSYVHWATVVCPGPALGARSFLDPACLLIRSQICSSGSPPCPRPLRKSGFFKVCFLCMGSHCQVLGSRLPYSLEGPHSPYRLHTEGTLASLSETKCSATGSQGFLAGLGLTASRHLRGTGVPQVGGVGFTTFPRISRLSCETTKSIHI